MNQILYNKKHDQKHPQSWDKIAAPKFFMKIIFIVYPMAEGIFVVIRTGLIKAYVLVSHGQVVSVQHIQYTTVQYMDNIVQLDGILAQNGLFLKESLLKYTSELKKKK